LSSVSTNVNGAGKRTLGVGQLEVAVLDRSRPRRAFRRITGAALSALLNSANPTAAAAEQTADSAPPKPANGSDDTPADDAGSS
jgi:proteasome alpha subunit